MRTTGKGIKFFVPLVSYIAYNAAIKAPFASLSCSLLNVGCLSYIPIHGFVDYEYKQAYQIFLNNFKQGRDIGASISAYVDGHQILSLQGGWQNVKENIEYTNETLQMVFSSTKAFVSSSLVYHYIQKCENIMYAKF
jgi:CubicO group peptidase (beta-lactamase class C family)